MSSLKPNIGVYAIEKHTADGLREDHGQIVGPVWLARRMAKGLREENDNRVTYRHRWLRPATAAERRYLVMGEETV